MMTRSGKDQQAIIEQIRIQLPAIVKSCLAEINSANASESAALKATLSDIKLSLDSMKKELIKVQESQEFIAAKFDDFEKQLKNNTTTIKKNEEIIETQKEQIQLLRGRTEEMDRQARLDLLEFHGIPVSSTEDTDSLVMDVIAKITSLDDSNCISFSHRKFKSSDAKAKPPPIIVKFTSRKIRNNIYEARSKLRPAENSPQAHTDTPKVFIVENLTEKNRNLLFEARDLKKELGYAYLWTNNGKVLIRKNQNSAALQINSMEDLNKMNEKSSH